jgi:integrase
MAKPKLSAVTLDRLKAPQSGRLELPDPRQPGLWLRVTPDDVRSWNITYRVDTPEGRKQRRLKIGDAKKMGLSAARDAARAALDKVDRGVDPAEERKAAKAPPPMERTFGAIADSFLERHAKEKRSYDEVKRIIEKYVRPRWSTRAIDGISKPDIVDLLDDVKDNHGPVQARQVHAVIRKLFNWCLDRGVIGASPCVRIPSPGEAVARDRVLSDYELAAVWRAIGTFKDPHAGLFKLLILLGQRRTETAIMRWADVDLERRLWTLPAETVKTGNVHVVPLPEAATEIINAQTRLGAYVFTFTGTDPITGFSVPKKLVDERSGVTGWTWHDLRRCLASGLARLGVGVHIIEMILNHKVGGISTVGRVYQRHQFLDERRTALEAWTRQIESVLNKKPGNVVTLQESVR